MSPRVLVVDDLPEIRALVRRALRDQALPRLALAEAPR